MENNLINSQFNFENKQKNKRKSLIDGYSKKTTKQSSTDSLLKKYANSNQNILKNAKNEADNYKIWAKNNFSDYDESDLYSEKILKDSYLKNNYINSKREKLLENENNNSYYDNYSEKIKNDYENSKNNLSNSLKTYEQNASITLDKMKKYIPEILQKSGLSGTGAEQNAYADAYAKYISAIGKARQDYELNISELDKALSSEKTKLELEKKKRTDSINDKYDNLEIENIGSAEKNLLSAYSDKIKNQTEIENKNNQNARKIVEKNIDNMIGKMDNFYNVNSISENEYEQIKNYITSNRSILGDPEYYAQISRIDNLFYGK